MELISSTAQGSAVGGRVDVFKCNARYKYLVPVAVNYTTSTPWIIANSFQALLEDVYVYRKRTRIFSCSLNILDMTR